MSNKVAVAGVGMIQFTKPGQSDDYATMGAAAANAALADAGIDYAFVQQAYVGYVFGDSICGQAAIYGVGLTGIPVINVNNNCATRSTALFLARQAVESGAIYCAIAVGFEQMVPGALTGAYADRPGPMERFVKTMMALQGVDEAAPRAAQFLGGASRDYMKEYGIKPETFGRISVKARRHAARNPFAVFRKTVTLEEVMASPVVFDPLTRLQCCPPTCGAAAAIICSEAFAKKHGLDRRVIIKAQSMTTDRNSSFDEGDMCKLIGLDMTRAAAQQVYEQAGVSPSDIDVVELHDCSTVNELITYEGLCLTPEGTAGKFIIEGDNTYGGRVVTNPSGGLLSKGHPPGATD